MHHITTRITISEPCAQKWDAMKEQLNSRFCESCNKSVIDFSTKTNREIIAYLQSKTDVCGRFKHNQLDQLVFYNLSIPKNSNWLKYLGILAIGASFLVQDVKAVVPKYPTAVALSHTNKSSFVSNSENVTAISGYVVDEDKKAIVGVKVIIANTNLYGITDKNGRYSISLPSNFNFKNNVLLVKNDELEGKLIANYKVEKQHNLVAEQISFILGKVAIVDTSKPVKISNSPIHPSLSQKLKL